MLSNELDMIGLNFWRKSSWSGSRGPAGDPSREPHGTRQAGQQRADDDRDQHVRGGERRERGLDPDATASPAMTIENSPRGISAQPGPPAARAARSRAPAPRVAGQRPSSAIVDGQRGPRAAAPAAMSRRVGGQPEEDEEDGGEQVPQRRQHGVRVLARPGRTARCRRGTRRRPRTPAAAAARPATNSVRPSTLSSSASASFEPTRAATIVAPYRSATTRTRPRVTTAIAERDRARRQADAGQHRGDQRQVERHRQVLDDEDRQDRPGSRGCRAGPGRRAPWR